MRVGVECEEGKEGTKEVRKKSTRAGLEGGRRSEQRVLLPLTLCETGK